jgi:hypothetical protein
MDDDRKLNDTLRKAFLSNSSVFAWKLEDTQIKKANLSPFKITEKYMTFKMDDESRYLINDLLDSKRDLKLYFEDQGLFVMSKVLEEGDIYLRVSRPEVYDFEERRSETRHFIDDFKVKITDSNGKAIIKNATDLGPGGFSIVLMKSESNPFKNSEHTEMELVKAKKRAKVEIIKEDKIEPFEYSATPYGGRRLAFSFIDKDNEVSRELNKIFERLSKSRI